MQKCLQYSLEHNSILTSNRKKIKRSWTQILQKAATRSSLALRTITVAKQQKHNKFFYSSVHSTEDAHQ